ncbi:MAG: nuclear transport factor 2 family protein [Solirubrobacteraceae bacterium]
MTAEATIEALYTAFNARDVDALLAAMSEDVDWPNGWKGGREHGKEAVRAYWLAQWAEIDPRVEPVKITTREDGRVAVDVDQVVKSLEGELLANNLVVHVYQLRDGLINRMDIEESG